MTHSVALSGETELVMPGIRRMNFYNIFMFIFTNIFSVSGGYGLDRNNPELYMPDKTLLVREGLTAPHAHVLLSPISV